jgi:hypothetical protein
LTKGDGVAAFSTVCRRIITVDTLVSSVQGMEVRACFDANLEREQWVGKSFDVVDYSPSNDTCVRVCLCVRRFDCVLIM